MGAAQVREADDPCRAALEEERPGQPGIRGAAPRGYLAVQHGGVDIALVCSGYMEDEGRGPTGPPSKRTCGPPRRRHVALAIVAAAGVALLATAGSACWRSMRSARRRHSYADALTLAAVGSVTREGAIMLAKDRQTCLEVVQPKHRSNSSEDHDGHSSETARAASIQLAPCEEGNFKQTFLLPDVDGAIEGVIRWKANHAWCVDVVYNRDLETNALQLWPCNDLPTQTWLFPEHGQGAIKWSAQDDKCIDGGRLRAAVGRVGVPEGVGKPKPTVQVLHCGGRDSDPHQFWLMPFKRGDKAASSLFPPTAQEIVLCEESLWPDRVNDRICGECKVPVAYFRDYYKTCRGYCETAGRKCVAAASVEFVGAEPLDESEVREEVCHSGSVLTCDDEHDSFVAICECGAELLRGQYGFLSDFAAPEDQLRQRVVGMYEKFHIREFLFFNAFEGFSQPPPFFATDWTCALQGTLVNRSRLVAAVEAVRTLRGRSWFFLHAAAADVGDQDLLSGHTVVNPTEVAKRLDPMYFQAQKRRMSAGSSSSPKGNSSEQQLCGCDGVTGAALDAEMRLIDVVLLNAAWALRFVPRWADFVAALKFSGIHWSTFGDLGAAKPAKRSDTGPQPQERQDEADVPGFLRAALPILRARNLEQTLSFVDGFGWDPLLLGGGPAGSWVSGLGRVIAFPFWEVWKNPMQNDKYFETVGSGHSFVLACYPGYSKYHCCARHEAQNRGSFGIEPLDIGIGRWKKAMKVGGSYLFVGDGDRFAKGPYLADSAQLSAKYDSKIQREVPLSIPQNISSMAAHSYNNYAHYIYGVRSDTRVYRQRLDRMSSNSTWQLVSKGSVFSIAISGQNIYGIDPKGRIMYQELEMMTPRSSWHLLRGQASAATAVSLQSLALDGDKVFGVSTRSRLMQETLSWTRNRAQWRIASDTQGIASICVHNGYVFAIDQQSGAIMRQPLAYMTPATKWHQLAPGRVISVAVHGDTIFAIQAPNHTLVKMKLSEVHTDATWETVSAVAGDLDAIAVSTGVVHI